MRTNRQIFRRLISLPLLALGVVAAAPIVIVAPVAAEDPCNLCAGGEYHPVTPFRIFDSRYIYGGQAINDVSPAGRKPASPVRPTFDVQLLGALTGSPNSPLEALTAEDVLGVMVSITVIDPTHSGWLAAVPRGSSTAKLTSIVNFGAGQIVPNLAVVRPGEGGQLTLQLFATDYGEADVLIDVFGWFSASSYNAGTPGDVTDERGARLIPISPVRVMETRPDYGGIGPLGAGEARQLKIRGVGAIDSPGIQVVPDLATVTGVLLNVTAVLPTRGTYISVLPEAPVGSPTTSNLNLNPGVIKANQVAVPIGEDGFIHLYNLDGSTNLVVDVVGYFQSIPDESRQGRVIPLTSPFRAFDTREAEFGAVPLGPGQAESWSFADFAASVNIGGVPVGRQLALIGNFTSASLDRQYPTASVSSFLTVYPGGIARPNVSNLNTVEGPPVPNMSIFTYSTDASHPYEANVFNLSGYSHYLLDVSAVVLAD